MKVIDGKARALEIKEQMKAGMACLKEKYGRVPCLAVIIVGCNPASQSYVRGKIKAAQFVGMNSRLIELPENISQAGLLDKIKELNTDPGVDGLLVQLPLPAHIDEDSVIDAIAMDKDVDGFHPQNVAGLWLGRKCIVPCTPLGIIDLIESTGEKIAGKKAVVVGRSNIVGKPVAKLLLDRNATVTIAHSRTKNLQEVCREADILVVAVGRDRMIDKTCIKPGAIVIDVGINRGEDGKLHGDVDFESASEVAGWLTPVPGGVGPMTIAMLMMNTVQCFKAGRCSRDPR